MPLDNPLPKPQTDVEAETPIFWPSYVKKWLLGKDPDAGKDWRREEKGMTGWDGWMASPTPRAYLNLCPLSRWCQLTISSCHPLLLPPSIFPSIRVFSNESVLRIKWPKYWSFSFSISTSKEYSGLISFRTDWLDLLAVQGILKSLLQHQSSKASILWHSAFFIVNSHIRTWLLKKP